MPTPESARAERGTRFIFVAAALVALAYVGWTDHRWEDYYITFRASKNLATGQGLVYQAGERLHTFTSPLGVLLPAFTSWVSGGRADEAALWLFRLISIAAFAGAVALVWKTGRTWGWRTPVCALTAVVAMTDAKSVGFSVNGMETGLMLFFLALSIYLPAAGRKGSRWLLGLAWAGLMWTRPDSFVYIAGVAAGYWLFPSAQKIAPDRSRLLIAYLGAGALCALLYGPWFLWAWHYYGSPIPNTVVAKGLGLGHLTLSPRILLTNLACLPYRLWHYRLGDGIFMPIYAGSGGWPVWAGIVSRVLILVALFAFALPRLRGEARALSLAVVAGLFYLVSYTQLYPWYVPSVTLLAILTLGGIAASLPPLLPAAVRANRLWLLPGLALALLSASLLGMSAWQIRWQQKIVEEQRRQIGLWLHDHRESPRDTVFLEPLGYIGYYSQLKMLDFPGLASKEVIAARRQVGDNWPELIDLLRPDWLVLRPREIGYYHLEERPWFVARYDVAKIFDSAAKIKALGYLPGLPYLRFDETFVVYHLHPTQP